MADNSWTWVATRNSQLAFWIYIVYCVLIVAISLFYLFYINRIITFFLSKAISYYAWRKFKIQVSVGALSLALLTGKVMFKNLSVYTTDQCFLASRGYVSFRFWLRKVQREGSPPEKNEGLPCRIRLRVDGFEWFLYNLTGKYDWLEEVLQGGTPRSESPDKNSKDSVDGVRPREEGSKQQGGFDTAYHKHQRGTKFTSTNETTNLFKFWSLLSKDLSDNKNLAKMPADDSSKDSRFRELLPVGFVGYKGSITVGNPHLHQMLVVQYQEAEGTFQCCRPRSVYDWYRTLLNVEFKELKGAIRVNADYRDPFMKTEDFYLPKSKRVATWLARFFGLYSLRKLFRRSKTGARDQSGSTLPDGSDDSDSFRAFNNSFATHNGEKPVWRGLQRYQELERLRQEHHHKFHEQYAKVSELLDIKLCSLRYYTDQPGFVPYTQAANSKASPDLEIGNGDWSPEWGCDVELYCTTINYGPWAERQRSEIQKFYFPQHYRDAVMTPTRQAGEPRIFTNFALSIKFNEKTTLRIPVRETSKDWQYTDDMLDLKSPNSPHSPTKKATRSTVSSRPYGWIDLHFDSGSTFTLNMPLAQTENGYMVQFEMNLLQAKVTTSVNYAPLLQAKQLQLCSQLCYPLKWNGAQSQQYSVTLGDPTIWLLNEHIALISDTISDFASGPATPVNYFVPCTYEIPISATNATLKLSLNEKNIVDHHNEPKENVYLTLSMKSMALKMFVDQTLYSPRFRSVKVNVIARSLNGVFSFPETSTLGKFQRAEQKVLSLEKLSTSVCYLYGTQTAADLLDSCTIKLKLRKGRIVLYGYIVRYLLMFPENYFNLHAKAVSKDEYLVRQNNAAAYETLRKRQEAYLPPSNPFDMHVSLSVSSLTAFLPENLYSSSSQYLKAGMLGLYCPSLTLENRSNTFYHYLKLSSSPIALHKFFAKEDIVDADGFPAGCNTDAGTSEKEAAGKCLEPALTLSPTQMMQETKFDASSVNSKPEAPLDLLGALSEMEKSPESLCLSDGILVTGHRCMGPLPEKPAYAMSYTVKLGSAAGELALEWLERLDRFSSGFMFHYNDFDNLLKVPKEVPDFMTVELILSDVNLSLWCAQSAIVRVALPKGLRLAYDNFMSEEYTKRLAVESQALEVEIVVPSESSTLQPSQSAKERYSDPQNSPFKTQVFPPQVPHLSKGAAYPGSSTSSWTQIFSLETKLSFLLFLRSHDWRAWVAKQREFVLSNDSATQRVSKFFNEKPRATNAPSVLQQWLPFQPTYAVGVCREGGSAVFADEEVAPNLKVKSQSLDYAFPTGPQLSGSYDGRWREALRYARLRRELSTKASDQDISRAKKFDAKARYEKLTPLSAVTNEVNPSVESLNSLLSQPSFENVDFEAIFDVTKGTERSQDGPAYPFDGYPTSYAFGSTSGSSEGTGYVHHIPYNNLLVRYNIYRSFESFGGSLTFFPSKTNGALGSTLSCEPGLDRGRSTNGSRSSIASGTVRERPLKFQSHFFRGCRALHDSFFSENLPHNSMSRASAASLGSNSTVESESASNSESKSMSLIFELFDFTNVVVTTTVLKWWELLNADWAMEDSAEWCPDLIVDSIQKRLASKMYGMLERTWNAEDLFFNFRADSILCKVIQSVDFFQQVSSAAKKMVSSVELSLTGLDLQLGTATQFRSTILCEDVVSPTVANRDLTLKLPRKIQKIFVRDSNPEIFEGLPAPNSLKPSDPYESEQTYSVLIHSKKVGVSVRLLEHPDWSSTFQGIPRAKQSFFKGTENVTSRDLDQEGCFPVVLDAACTNVNIIHASKPQGSTASNCNLSTVSLICVNEALEVFFGSVKSWMSAWRDSSAVIQKYSTMKRCTPPLYLAYIAELLLEEDLAVQIPLLDHTLSSMWSLSGRHFSRNYSWILLSHLRRCQAVLSHSQGLENDWLSCWSNYFVSSAEFPSSSALLKKIFEMWDYRGFSVSVDPFSKISDVQLLSLLLPDEETDRVALSSVLPVLKQPSENVEAPAFSNTDSPLLDKVSWLRGTHHFDLGTSHVQLTIYSPDAEENFLSLVSPSLNGRLTPAQHKGLSDSNESSKVSLVASVLSPVGSNGSRKPSAAAISANSAPSLFSPNQSTESTSNHLLANLVFYVKEAVWSFNPLQLVFFLHARHIYNKMTESQPGTLPSAQGSTSSILNSLSLNVQSVFKGEKLVVRAGNRDIAMVGVIRDAFTSNLHFIKPDCTFNEMKPTKEILAHLVCAGMSSMTLQAMESSTELISIKFDNVLGNATVSQQAMSHPGQSSLVTGQNLLEKLTLFASVSGVKVQVLRTFLNIHAFFEKWTDQGLLKYEFLFSKLADQWVSPESGVKGSGPYFESKLSHELKEQPVSFVVDSISKPLFDFIHLQFKVSSFTVESDVLNNLRFGYNFKDWVIFVDQSAELTGNRKRIPETSVVPSAAAKTHQGGPAVPTTSGPTPLTSDRPNNSLYELKTNFFVQIAKQEITFATKQLSRSVNFNSHRAVFVIPSIALEGCVFHPIHTVWVVNNQIREKVRVETRLSMDFVELKLSVNVLDQLLTAYSVIYSEIVDLMEIMAFYKRRNVASTSGTPIAASPLAEVADSLGSKSSHGAKFLYSVKLSFAGFRIGVESPKAVAFCDSRQISGFMINHPHSALLKYLGTMPKIWQHVSRTGNNISHTLLWRISADNFAFSIHKRHVSPSSTNLQQAGYVLVTFSSQNFAVPGPGEKPYGHKHTKSIHTVSTFSTMDKNFVDPSLQGSTLLPEQNATNPLPSKVTADGGLWSTVVDKCFAVMQPLAIQCIGDIFLFYTTELERRRELKYEELAAFEVRARALIKSIDQSLARYRVRKYHNGSLQAPDSSQENSFSRKMELTITRFGIALPLQSDLSGTTTSAEGASLPQFVGATSGTPPSFFISADSVYFSSKINQESTLTVKEMGFQFVPMFNLTSDASFNPTTHGSSNRLFFPKICAQLNTSLETTSNMESLLNVTLSRVVFSGNATGFELDLDDSVAIYISMLFEIYQKNKMERLFAAFALSSANDENIQKSHASRVEETPLQLAQETELESSFDSGNKLLQSELTGLDALGQQLDTGSDASSSELNDLANDNSKLSTPNKLGTVSLLDIKGSVEFGASSCRLHSTSGEGGDGRQYNPHQLIVLPGTKLKTFGTLLLSGDKSKIEQVKQALKPTMDLRQTGLYSEIEMEAVENNIYPVTLLFCRQIIEKLQLNAENHFSQETAPTVLTSSVNVARVVSEKGVDSLDLHEPAQRVVEDLKPDLSGNANTPSRESVERHAVASPTGSLSGAADVIDGEAYALAHTFMDQSFSFLVKCSSNKLVLCCEPKAKVNAVVLFSNFQLLLCSFPSIGSKTLNRKCFTGAAQVEGVSVYLQHQFSPESCVRTEVGKLLLSGTLQSGVGALQLYVPSVKSHCNARYLQDYYIFDQLWVREVPKLLAGLQGVASHTTVSFPKPKSFSGRFGGDNGASPIAVVLKSSNEEKVLILATVNNIESSIDLGHSLGKSVFTFDNVDIGLVRQATRAVCQLRSLSAFCERICIKSEGKFSGQTTAENLMADCVAVAPHHDLKKDGSCATVAWLNFDSVSSNIQYQFERIALFESKSVTLFMRDWLPQSVLHLVNTLEIDTVKGVISRKTLPTMLYLVEKVTKLILEKRDAAVLLPQGNPGSKLDDGVNAEGVVSVAKSRSKASISHRLNALFSQNLTRLRVQIRSTLFHIMKYNFRDPEYAQVNVKDFQVSFVELCRASDDQVRKQLTKVLIGGMNIRKSTCKPISQNEERSWDMGKWFSFLGSASGKNVIAIPHSEVQLDTLCNHRDLLVLYQLGSNFKGAVDVALNFGLYRFLQELAVLYERALTSDYDTAPWSGPGGATTAGNIVSPVMNVTSPASLDLKGEVGAPDASATSALNPTTKGTGASKAQLLGTTSNSAVPSKWIYEKAGVVQFEPQLKVIGDATPKEWLDLLGLHKHNVPQKLHSGLTEHLETAIYLFQELYLHFAILEEKPFEMSGASLDKVRVESFLQPGPLNETETFTSSGYNVKLGMKRGVDPPLDSADDCSSSPTGSDSSLSKTESLDTSSMVSAVSMSSN